jgi:hypothetical protein
MLGKNHPDLEVTIRSAFSAYSELENTLVPFDVWLSDIIQGID